MTDRKRYIFIRDDDVYNLDNKFLKTLELCLNERVPIIYGIIPCKLKKKLADFLCAKKTTYPSYLDITQHGWNHTNYNKKKIIHRYEFGPERNYKEQKKDITSGYIKMVSVFDELFTPAFIPPYHSYNSTTLKIIDKLNFGILSAGIIKSPFKSKNLIYLPAQVSVNKYTPSFKSLPLSLTAMIKEVLYYINSCRVTGIYFHHNTLNKYNFDIFAKYINFLKNLSKLNQIKFILFSDILKMVNYNEKS